MIYVIEYTKLNTTPEKVNRPANNIGLWFYVSIEEAQQYLKDSGFIECVENLYRNNKGYLAQIRSLSKKS